MRIFYLVILFVTTFTGYGQNTISGNFSPAEDYNWLIAYKVSASGLDYVTDGKVEQGRFSLEIPANSGLGTYRLVYAIPQEEYHIDVIYNGKEDISLRFDSTAGLSFESSDENILIDTYYKDRYRIEGAIIEYYQTNDGDKQRFHELFDALKESQQHFEQQSKGMMANAFIRSNAPYIPKNYESIEQIIANRKATYFEAIDLENPILQNSGFLKDKMQNFVFTALPLTAMNEESIQLAMNQNIAIVADHLDEVSDRFKLNVFHAIWSEASKNTFHIVSDSLYENYIKALATKLGDQAIKATIETYNRLRFGATAPDIQWKAESTVHSLSGLPANEHFILVFWSSTCSHCLSELPKLHSLLKSQQQITVVAIGLEDSAANWNNEIKKLSRFNHAISLGKWESDYAALYAIQQTPSYYVLDSSKKIIAKPSSLEELLEIFAIKSAP